MRIRNPRRTKRKKNIGNGSCVTGEIKKYNIKKAVNKKGYRLP